MNMDLTEWDEDLESDEEEEYQALLRTLKRTQGFALLFVECSLARGNKLIEEVRRDLPQKSIEVLQLKEAVENFYEVVKNLQNREQINILFVQGLEHSFYEYEQNQALSGWDSSKRYSYSWEGVPRVLMNLNQQRERLRDHFPVCFVFLLPLFGSKYFIQRAPDFFDWRSGFFEFPRHQQQKAKFIEIKTLSQTSKDAVYLAYFVRRLLLSIDAKSTEEAIDIISKAIEIASDKHEDCYIRCAVLGNLERAEEAIAFFDKALEIKPGDHEAWYNRGAVLSNLGRYEEAIDSFDKVVKIKPDDHKAWYGLGSALDDLGRYEEAITFFDKALEIKPGDHEAWYNRGAVLSNLGRYEEAIASFDKALEIKPDSHEIWNNRGYALSNLGRTEEAIASYDKAVNIKPDYHYAWYNKAWCYALQGNADLALKNLQQAIQLNPDKYRQMAATESDFDSIREDSRFQMLIQGDQENNRSTPC
ncbi:tetratricopeptide repeat protein [Microcoleus sp. FACHB-672]|uniref:tetratricopeptide repeat protein n=1 Tax=Microcoleus sp. FACHB-672 TaxID=2692825 RepID=UPI001683ED1D|nr:tetratricopeptide repeat protein [Microcoleus sp. FACHB-672]MBD2042618.1 tetratricopeptide repeat protein [Microcoleus sp. FACHB-672]